MIKVLDRDREAVAPLYSARSSPFPAFVERRA